MSPPRIKFDILETDNSFDRHSGEILSELNTKEGVYCADNDIHFISLYDLLEGNVHD